MSKTHDNWEQVLRGKVLPDKDNPDEVLAFFVRKAMIRKEIEENIQRIDTTTAFNNLMQAVESIEKGKG